MAKVNTSKASRDYPAKGILKGQTYYWWQLFKQPKQMSLTPPKGSQLTGSSKVSATRAAFEDLEEVLGAATTPDDAIDALNACAEALQEVADEYRESKENMPESLQESPTGQQCEENADNLEVVVSEIEDAVTEIDSMDVSEFIDGTRIQTLAEDQLEEEFEGDGEYEEDGGAVEERVTQLIEAVKDFSDLNTDEQREYMEKVSDYASSPSCPL